MPHLTYRNRYWKVAGDEFAIPAFCSVIFRLFWTIIIAICLVFIYSSLLACHDTGWLLIIFLLCSMVVFLMSIICDACLLLVSLKGSIIEHDKRSSLSFYLDVKFFFGLLNVMCAMFGIASLVITNRHCNLEYVSSENITIFMIVVIASQLLDTSALVCCCYVFSSSRIDASLQPIDEDWALDTWENRCRTVTRSMQICTCNLFGGSNITEGFDQVAKVFTDFFHHDGFLDVVPSDVVAGLVLVRLEQRSQRKRKVRISIGSSEVGAAFLQAKDTSYSGAKRLRRKDASFKDLEMGLNTSLLLSTGSSSSSSSNHSHSNSSIDTIDINELENIARCSVFAMAIYTHLLLMYLRPCTGFCRLCTFGVCRGHDGTHDKKCCSSCCCCNRTVLSSMHPSPSRAKKCEVSYDSVTHPPCDEPREIVIKGDNLCGLHRTGLSIITEHLSNTEVVFGSFVNDTYHKVYAVLLDHDKEQVVVVVRGTLSIEDCITDVICEPVEVGR